MNWSTYLESNQKRFVGELQELLRIPSVSALPEHAGDVRRAGEWVMERLLRAGIEAVEILETGGHPVVYGEWLHAPGRPTVLIYGHFDVQPADPVELWTHPPFEPVIAGDRIFARGASDDKGNMLVPILSVEALLADGGGLPINLKFLLEGQEEIGSPQLPAFVAAERQRLACDFVLSADGVQWGEEEPSILVGLKGLAALELEVRGAKSDLHSGLHGGAIPNALHALVRILDSMRSADGKILVEGFYDRVLPLNERDREQIAAVPYDEESYKRSLGLSDVFGEPGFTTRERQWARPTLEINGLWGGFQGAGTKTVIPNLAQAKITCRLVAEQEPEEINRKLIAHVERHSPPGVTVEARPLSASARPYLLASDHPGNLAARKVLRELYGREPYDIRMGGSIPVVPLFRSELGADTVNFAFALQDENFHAPDEFFRLASFERGQRAYCRLIEELGES